jgi:hypothetical protein
MYCFQIQVAPLHLGRTVNALHKSGRLFPIHLVVDEVEVENDDGSTEVQYSGRIMLPKANTDDTRHARCTVRDDGGLLQVGSGRIYRHYFWHNMQKSIPACAGNFKHFRGNFRHFRGILGVLWEFWTLTGYTRNVSGISLAFQLCVFGNVVGITGHELGIIRA